jgi:hypothetical protein
MAFTTGSATDFHDLLEQLKDYLDTEGWTVQEWDLGATLTDPSTLVVTGPGISGGQLVNVSIKSEADAPSNAYTWKICGHPDYDSGLTFGNQINNSPFRYFLLWPNAMDYWFYVNDSRFIVVAKIGSYYMSMYAGFFLPYALPEEYPYPYYIGASWDTLAPYNYDDAGVRSFVDPGDSGACYLRRETLVWTDLKNSQDSANDVDAYAEWGGAMIWPLRGASVNTISPNGEDELYWSWLGLLRPLANGVMPLWQATIVDVGNETLTGVLDGVFLTGGFNSSPEQVVTYDAQDYRLFLNTNRATNKHYFAIEES